MIKAKNKLQDNDEMVAPHFDEVLKRMLSTPPKPHPKPAKKVAKKKTAK